ncbi:MAG: 4a-hydroxytetrahydrobiopterin dehydratase [Candidatus Sericytochromatia bacterium]
MALTDKKIISSFLSEEKLIGWFEYDGYIQKEFIFKDFKQAMIFVNKVAHLAELENHHPDINIRWNKVLLSLYTHDEGGITDKDINLAEKINKV